MDEYIAYHPKILEYANPNPASLNECEQVIRRNLMLEFHKLPHEQEILIPCCPCCGEGRTLFCHIKKEPALIIQADFTDWCHDCRRKLAQKVKL